jgi:hypothetical protein
MNCIKLFAALVCALPVISAHAGRPLATEDAGVLARGDCEWESFAARATERNSDAVSTLSTQLGCGVGHGSQLQLALLRESSGGQHANGLVLGGKTGLIERKDDAPGLTLAWGLVAAKQPGDSFKHERTALNLVVSTDLAKDLSGHANLGWARSHSLRQSATTWNFAAEYALGNGVDVLAEYYGQSHDKPALGAGLRIAVTEKFNVDASYAVQSGTAKAKLFTVGAKLAF